jgi:hypothetical protein
LTIRKSAAERETISAYDIIGKDNLVQYRRRLLLCWDPFAAVVDSIC